MKMKSAKKWYKIRGLFSITIGSQGRMENFIKELLSAPSKYVFQTALKTFEITFKTINNDELQENIYQWLKLRHDTREELKRRKY